MQDWSKCCSILSANHRYLATFFRLNLFILCCGNLWDLPSLAPFHTAQYEILVITCDVILVCFVKMSARRLIVPLFSRLCLTRSLSLRPLQGSLTLTWTMSNDLPVLTSLTENSTVSILLHPSCTPVHPHTHSPHFTSASVSVV